MASLANPQWEKFAKALANGCNQVDAGSIAGYSVKSAGNMSKLAARPEIRARVGELSGHEYVPQQAWTCDEVTRLELIERAQVAYNLAQSQERPSDMLKCLTFIGEMAGYGKPVSAPVARPPAVDPKEAKERQARVDAALDALRDIDLNDTTNEEMNNDDADATNNINDDNQQGDAAIL